MTTKNEVATVEAEIVNDEKHESLVDALFDVGTAWAEYGIGYGKFALENSAKVLARTADALGKIQARLKSDDKAA